ncbi:hypothetical protein GQ53DRAFT_847839 [Thozetella sp. PMI_491]|nr:hypothetical protein GQ53DRAFT_847839 [Thozetella sp. PMI_491]
MAKINQAAYARETISQFALKHWPDEQNMLAFMSTRLGERLAHPQSQVFKATDPDSGKIYGFVCFTLENGSEGGAEPVAANPMGAAIKQLGQFMNLDFVMAMQMGLEQMKSGLMNDKHYYLSAFAVDPAYQGQGIGTQLLEHCLPIADRAGLRTWLNAFPGSHSLYLRHGFANVMHHDLDLNEWDKGRLRGFGIYRSYLMARKPQNA